MRKNLKLGDFDLDIREVVLVHRCTFDVGYRNCDYRAGRKIAGFVYCLDGRGRYDFDGETLMLEPGRMIFLPAESAYTVRSAGTEPFRHITVNFNLADTTGDEHTAFSEIQRGRLRYVSSKENAAVFKELLDRLIAVWQSKSGGYAVLAKSVLYEILYLYFTDAGRGNSSRSDYQKILPAKVLLDERYTENTPVGELAALCRLSETHFRRLFVRLFGCSPVDYRLNKRILKAKDLLLSGEYSVARTAAAVGFEDANYFSRVFRAHTGVTPSDVFKTQSTIFAGETKFADEENRPESCVPRC